MTSSPPSWLKTTPLNIEEIARHNTPHTVYLPALTDNDERDTLAPEKYDLPFQTSNNDSLSAEFQWQHLSQESGIYHKQYNFPRSFLWRVVSGSTLTIHPIDSIRPKSFPRNRPLTALHFRFPVKIRLNCVGFQESAETPENTVLNVLTEDCVLYTVSLHSGVFTGEKKGTERMMEDMIVQRPLFMLARFGAGKLSLDLPHFMYSVQNTDTVLFAMQDGSLQVYNTQSTSNPQEKQTDKRLCIYTFLWRRNFSEKSQSLDPNVVRPQLIISLPSSPLIRRLHKAFSPLHRLRRPTSPHLVSRESTIPKRIRSYLFHCHNRPPAP